MTTATAGPGRGRDSGQPTRSNVQSTGIQDQGLGEGNATLVAANGIPAALERKRPGRPKKQADAECEAIVAGGRVTQHKDEEGLHGATKLKEAKKRGRPPNKNKKSAVAADADKEHDGDDAGQVVVCSKGKRSRDAKEADTSRPVRRRKA